MAYTVQYILTLLFLIFLPNLGWNTGLNYDYIKSVDFGLALIYLWASLPLRTLLNLRVFAVVYLTVIFLFLFRWKNFFVDFSALGSDYLCIFICSKASSDRHSCAICRIFSLFFNLSPYSLHGLLVGSWIGLFASKLLLQKYQIIFCSMNLCFWYKTKIARFIKF